MEKILRSAKSLMKTTDNRGVYNRARKKYLERNGLIKCSLCGYNRGENDYRKYYGTVRSWYGGTKVRYPSWKLSTKNRKQWVNKPESYKVITKSDYDRDGYIYVDIKF